MNHIFMLWNEKRQSYQDVRVKEDITHLTHLRDLQTVEVVKGWDPETERLTHRYFLVDPSKKYHRLDGPLAGCYDTLQATQVKQEVLVA